MKPHLTILFIALIFCGAYYFFYKTPLHTETDTMLDSNKRMTLMLAAPSVDNEYYSDHFDEIVDFQTNYLNRVINAWYDDIFILVPTDAIPYYTAGLSPDYIIEREMYDIWMRDFSTVNPDQPVQFTYTDASMSERLSQETQKAFNTFAADENIIFEQTNYILDGGNIVDNYHGKAITTSRFLEDNDLEYGEAKEILSKLLNAEQIAIIDPDDEVLAHADGMVARLDDNVLAVNDYSSLDPEFHNIIMDELRTSFPEIKIITVPVDFDEDGGLDTSRWINSACGIHLNLVATHTTLYVPTFNSPHDSVVLDIIKKNTSKHVVEIDATGVCAFWWSVRCLTWQRTNYE